MKRGKRRSAVTTGHDLIMVDLVLVLILVLVGLVLVNVTNICVSNHRRSHDLLWGALFSSKVDDLFSRPPQYTD